jgi:hypothetical protein
MDVINTIVVKKQGKSNSICLLYAKTSLHSEIHDSAMLNYPK